MMSVLTHLIAASVGACIGVFAIAFCIAAGDDRKPKPGEVGYWPYPHPCPWREKCINYKHFLETGNSCSGEYAACDRGQLAAGRIMPEWRWRLMSPYQRHYLKGVVLGDPKELKAFKRCERAIERMDER